MEPGETAEVAVVRELKEEISYAAPPASVSLFCCDVEGDVVRHVFHAQLSADVKDLVLLEGWDMKLLTPDDIRAGVCYSEKAGNVRSLSLPHQRILLNFIESRIMSATG
jgi:ADP-ribose pyrophosphatase YjhB (NUDIX family)